MASNRGEGGGSGRKPTDGGSEIDRLTGSDAMAAGGLVQPVVQPAGGTAESPGFSCDWSRCVLVRDQEVAGLNPVSPILSNPFADSVLR